MPEPSLNGTEKKTIAEAIALFEKQQHLFHTFADSLLSAFRHNQVLLKHIHFTRFRLKDIDHLQRKLERKIIEGKVAKAPFGLTKTNLFEKVTDLAGIRLIHLNTDQMKHIHPALGEVFEEQQLRVIDGGTANCWDIEYQQFFNGIGVQARSRSSMYTTVHYTVEANQRTKIACEIQVRTLADELWGEVSHRINYPVETASQTCQNQLKVLARLTTGCARLVDSIISSNDVGD